MTARPNDPTHALELATRRLAFAEACLDCSSVSDLVTRVSGLLFDWAQPDVVAVITPHERGEPVVAYARSRQPILTRMEWSTREILADLAVSVGFSTEGPAELPMNRGPELMAVPSPLRDDPVHCFWSAPLICDGQTIGLIALLGFNDWIVGARVSELLEHVAPMISRGLNSAQCLERLRAHALEDELTGAVNRRGFYSDLEREIARAQRSGRPLSVLTLDLDHFKQVNDTYGHAEGDAVLCGVAAVLVETLRRSDVVGRLGGDEFAVLLPEIGSALAERVAERAAEAVRSLTYGDGKNVGLSMGIATLDPRTPCTLEALLARADSALYDAKRSGRNRVSHAG